MKFIPDMSKLFGPILLSMLTSLLMEVQIWSQHLNRNLEFYSSQLINSQINQSTIIIHSGFKPLLISTLSSHSISDSALLFPGRDKLFSDKLKSGWIYRKLRTEDFINYQSKNFNLKANPLVNLSYKKGRDEDQIFFMNTRGIEFKGSIGKKFSFYTSFYENQARFEPYVTQYIKKALVAPGQGAVKILDNDKFDFSRASAYFSLSPTDKINIQGGHSKHFIGEGYRSLLLSDNSFNYPFLKLSVTFGKFQYQLMWNQYQLFSGAYYNYHRRKYGAISYLSWAPAAGFEISLFESVMWPGNTPEKQNNFNLNFFNPLLLSRTLIYGLDNEKNILLGINTRLKIYNFGQFFGQFALDNIDGDNSARNNFAFQLGVKHFDLFHHQIKNQSLYLHIEYNFVAPYTYAWQDPMQSISHYNQPLVHPSGSGLKEILATTCYSFKDINLTIRGSYTVNSVDTLNANFGSDVFKPDKIQTSVVSHNGNTPGQGIKNELIHFYSELSFMINPSSNMKLFIGANLRKSLNAINNSESLFYSIGIKTDLNNYYYDF